MRGTTPNSRPRPLRAGSVRTTLVGDREHRRARWNIATGATRFHARRAEIRLCAVRAGAHHRGYLDSSSRTDLQRAGRAPAPALRTALTSVLNASCGRATASATGWIRTVAGADARPPPACRCLATQGLHTQRSRAAKVARRAIGARRRRLKAATQPWLQCEYDVRGGYLPGDAASFRLYGLARGRLPTSATRRVADPHPPRLTRARASRTRAEARSSGPQAPLTSSSCILRPGRLRWRQDALAARASPNSTGRAWWRCWAPPAGRDRACSELGGELESASTELMHVTLQSSGEEAVDRRPAPAA